MRAQPTNNGTFRQKPSAALMTFVGAALIAALSVGLAGRISVWAGGLLFGAGLAGMAMAWVKYRYRLTMDAGGIRVPRRPVIPWGTVTDCVRHDVGPLGGLEIVSVGPQGNTQRIFVPKSLERPREATELLIQLAALHDAPWVHTENYETFCKAHEAAVEGA